jgi:hypothetical protein
MQAVASSEKYAKYNHLIFIMSFVMLSVVVLFIFQATDDYQDGYTLMDKAVRWQSSTKGTVGLPIPHSTLFKDLSVKIQFDESKINALVLGSSTMMGIRREMFPKGMGIYNYSKNSNPLKKIIGEAYYFVEKYDNVKWIVMGMDFSLGMTVDNFRIVRYRDEAVREKISFRDKFFDAITLSRLKITLKNIFQNPYPDKERYPCPENDGIGKDFGTVLRPGGCAGFRYDGSATFNYHKMNKALWKSQLNEKALNLYISNLRKLTGRRNESFLNHLKKVNDRLVRRSGGLILVYPPLMPNAQDIILKSAVGKDLKKYKKEIKEWASINKIKILDAGKSEEYGCVPEEFYDAHHALARCYSKIFNWFFKNNRDVI